MNIIFELVVKAVIISLARILRYMHLQSNSRSYLLSSIVCNEYFLVFYGEVVAVVFMEQTFFAPFKPGKCESA